jgi:hypothetical protein
VEAQDWATWHLHIRPINAMYHKVIRPSAYAQSTPIPVIFQSSQRHVSYDCVTFRTVVPRVTLEVVPHVTI